MTDRGELTFDARELLETKVLPTARRWVDEYPPGHALHRHGRQTLEYWGEVEPEPTQ